MIRACVIDFKGYQHQYLPLCEFASNNRFHSYICMAPFETFRSIIDRSLIRWFSVFKLRTLGTDMLKDLMEKVRFNQEK